MNYLYIVALVVAIVGTLAVVGALTLIFVRYMTTGKIIAIMHGSRTLGSYLLKEDVEHHCLWVGKDNSENRERYDIDEGKIILVRWPGALPWFLSVPVRALEYVRGNPIPWDPETTHKSSITAKTYRLITDENMLKNAWRDVREGLGLSTAKSRTALYLMFGVVGAIALGLINLWMTSQTQSGVKAALQGLKAIYDLLGGK